ncbi:glycosyltransferase family 4 protein [Paenibacillus sp. FA6]|uniref:glycosyltransferase family 4 protein n=1 Tax=Paenibacillus sp. FA6 TaxID=3413029 RepID=UPI003F656211
MKIIMIGPVPPPVGGISVHIKRIQKRLRDEGIQCDVYNEANDCRIEDNIYSLQGYKRFLFKIPFIRGDLFHFHTINRTVRMLLGCYKIFGKKIILTVHGESLMQQIKNSNAVVRFLLLKSLQTIDQIVCVNEEDTQELVRLGFSEHKVITIPAYIQPVECESNDLAIPNEVLTFIEGAKFVITANGFIRFHQRKDLYGVDLLIDLLKKLTEMNYDVRILFATLGVASQSVDERNYYSFLRKRIKMFNLEDRFLFYEVSNTELFPLVRKSHLFVRPTTTDGYGVSIAEALYYSIPSIASDVCKRPDGTILFQSRNIHDLIQQVQDVMNNYPVHKQRASVLEQRDYAMDLLEVYFKIAGQRSLESKVILDECRK